jgi:very-short-patch-repair endonuclease
MRKLLEAREAGGSESRLETRLLQLIRSADLPLPVRQHRIWSGRRIIARADLAYPRERIAIEADGRGVHARPRTWQRDIEKMNALARLGWRFLRFTWSDVNHDPKDVVETISDLLRA